MNENVLQHHNIMVQIKSAIENFFREKTKAQLPEQLIADIISNDDDRQWAWFFSCLELKRKNLESSGYNTRDFVLPKKVQGAIIARAQNGKFDEVNRYIEMMPFDEDLHLEFWKACRKQGEIIAAYISSYSFRDDVLDRFWENSPIQMKLLYLAEHTITRSMAKKMWCANAEKNPKEWAQFYLQFHPVPDGVVEDLYCDIPYVLDIWDLLEFSTQPFGDNDEVFMVEHLKGEDVAPYVDAFGLKPKAQEAMLRGKNKELIRHFIDEGWDFCLEAQRFMVTPEFLQNGGKDLLAHYLKVEPVPFAEELGERIQLLFE